MQVPWRYCIAHISAGARSTSFDCRSTSLDKLSLCLMLCYNYADDVAGHPPMTEAELLAQPA